MPEWEEGEGFWTELGQKMGRKERIGTRKSLRCRESLSRQ